MTARRLGKKILKITGITLGILLVLLIAFHFWFKAHAKGMIEDLVESTSHGKVKLKIGKLHFSYFSRKIELENAVFYSTDTLNSPTTYRFSVEKIKLKAKAILPIVFKKRILIDSLNLLSPHIEVTRLKEIERPDKKGKEDISIPEEMGKVYTSIQDALQVLKVKRFQIDDGTFTLINKITPNQLPMKITNLSFHMDNLKVDTSKFTGKEKILFSDNVVFKSHDQDILFPDGRHRLSFSNFRINIKKKVVEFDSCTIAATRSDSSNASFNVFFDALFLTNIDFDTLYKSEVIKADSVYCINPKFNLEVEVGKRKGSNKPPPKLENIIKQLTGDLQLKYVIVTNADFNIKTIKDGRPSTFTFSKNNFEMQGLDIDQEAAKPIKVKSFAMAIRNYENFIKDSSYSISFDSVLFKDDRITLSNFIFNKLENGKISNSFSIPQFNLQGLSWDELVFNRRLKAEQAIMFSPHINYTASADPQKRAKQKLFVSLGAVNDFMDLQYLDILDGTIDLRLKNNLRVQLENANVSVQSNSLLTSTKISSIKNSLTNLNFKKGRVQSGDLLIEFNDTRYAGTNGEFKAASFHIKSEQKKMNISLHDVLIQKLLVDETTGSVFANDMTWRNGNVDLGKPLVGPSDKPDPAIIEFHNIKGSNTLIRGNAGSKSVSTKLNTIFFSELTKRPGIKLKLEGLAVNGEQLKIKDDQLDIAINNYDITDNKPSSFKQVSYKNKSSKMEADISIPSLKLIPHIQSLLDGSISMDEVNLEKPVIHLELIKNNTDSGTKNKAGKINISGLKLTQPSIHFTQTSDSGLLSLSWHGEKNNSNFLQAGEIHASDNSYKISDLQFYLTDLVMINPKGRSFNTGEGKVSAQLNNINYKQEEGQDEEWDINIAGLDARDFRLDSMGRSKAMFVMKSGALNNLDINSSTITNLQQLVAANKNFGLKQFTGQYTDVNNQLKWYNAGFTRNNNRLTTDSFSMLPVLSKDSFITRQTFQKDYVTLRSGAINAGPVDLEKYIKSNQLDIGTVVVDKFTFTDFKEKQLPFHAGIIKPLPAGLLAKIPLQLSIDTVSFTNAHITYTETGEKTKRPGTIPVTRMTARLQHVRNYNIGPLDSLNIEATAYLMDTAWIRLRVKESYADTMGGFIMALQLKPADMTVLNPALIPLLLVKIESGMIDTVSLKATGREYLAWGEMKMFYHGLKVKLLKADGTKNGFLTTLVNFVIKNKNTSRTGDVFFIRKRDRSAINYLIKIALSGISSSVGAKNNKKQIRRHQKEIGNKQPAPDLD